MLSQSVLFCPKSKKFATDEFSGRNLGTINTYPILLNPKMKNHLQGLKKQAKRLIVKTASMETVYGQELKKFNIIPSESIATPEAPKMTFIEPARFLQAETHSTPHAYTTILSGVFYCPLYSVILTKNREIISETLNVVKPPEDFRINDLFTLNIEVISGYSAIWHQTTNNYYHTLIDNLSRFYLTSLHDEFQKEDTEIKLLHSRSISNMEKFYLTQFLRPNIQIISVTNNSKMKEKPKLFYIERLFLSTFLNHKFSAFIPSAYRQAIYHRFLPQRARVRRKRIYISRAESYNQRHITNESELLKALDKFGFQKYILENMPLSEQIELFYDAEVVVAPHGAGLSNIIFSDNIKVLELFPYPFVIPYFYYLAKSMGHTYQYWCGNCQYNNTQGWNNNFVVDIPKLQQILEFLFSSEAS